MKAIYTLLLLISFSGFAQIVETNVTNSLNTPCNATTCTTHQLGVCPGDTHADGTPYTYTGFNVWYVLEDIDFQHPYFILRNGRLEFRNGASLINNGVVVDIQTDCDSETGFTTEIVFIGGGGNFASFDEMNATLGIKIVESLDIFNLPIGESYQLLALTGQVINTGIVDQYTKDFLKSTGSGINILHIQGYKALKIVN